MHAFDFVDARSLVDEFARQIRQELDYRLEGRNAQTFRRNFAGDPHVQVPKVYWTYSRARVLTLEWLEGTQLADVDSLDLTLPERRDLAYLVAETWMTMIFRHGFFHGDPHPANVLVLEEAGTIGLVDFGAAGTLSDDPSWGPMVRYLRKLPESRLLRPMPRMQATLLSSKRSPTRRSSAGG